MIPSFKHGIIASSRPRVVAAASDVTPNAVNWNDVVSAVSATTNTVTITGINTAINLSISYTGYSVGVFDVYKNGTEFSLTDNNPYTLSVSNNDQVYFFYNGGAGEETTVSVTVTNVSDGNTVLDTFTMTAFQGGGGGG
jgi:hypothetical protein